MAGQQFLDVLAMKTKVKGPSNSVRLCADENGTLLQSIKGASFAGFVSGDKKDMFKARAQAFITGEFTTQWEDYFGANTQTQTSGFAATSAAAQQAGQGGSVVKFTSSGATGFHYEGTATPSVGGIVAYNVKNIIWTPWYVEAGVIPRALTGNCERFHCGLTQGPMANLDASAGQYIGLGYFGAISSTFLVVKSWNGSVVSSQITTIPVELNAYRRYGIGNDGMGTLAVTRDGVKFLEFPMFTAQAATSAHLFQAERSNGGTTDVDVDYYACAAGNP